MRLYKTAAIALCLSIIYSVNGQNSWSISSPGNKVTATVQLADLGGQADYPAGQVRLYYAVAAGGPSAYSMVIESSPMGLIRSDQNFLNGLTFVSEGQQRTIDSVYTMLMGKRLVCRNFCNEKTLTFQAGTSKLELVLRAYDDGFAFRYRFPETNAAPLTVSSEATGFRPPANSIMWMQPYNLHTTGEPYAPAYEDRWQRNIPVGSQTYTTPTVKPVDGTWCMPILFKTPAGSWGLVWETDVLPTYCNSRLSAATTAARVYRITFPDKNEWIGTGAVTPSSTLPWTLPWRVVITGSSPGTILESTLSTDLATPCALTDVSWIKPGRSSWSWWSDNTSPTSYAKMTPFIDLAQQMTWEYHCVDAVWNTMTGGTWQQLVTYAAGKGVGISVWYNGGVPGGPTQAPTGKMLDSAIRNAEMKTISDAGVKGIKIDFWLSDKQICVKYYFDVFRDAAKYHLFVDPHGCTIPRGWQRTYPNCITAEANRGAENYIWFAGDVPFFPWQNTMMPFTRNAVASMDWTPTTFTNQANAHATTYGHELALSIVFESGIQHFADRVSGYQTTTITAAAQTFLKQVPVVWDDTKYLQGYPGSFVVLARRKGFDWYMGGIVGDTARSVTVPLSFLAGTGSSYQMTRIADGTTKTTFSELTGTVAPTESITVPILANGGFVAKFVNLNPTSMRGPNGAMPKINCARSSSFRVAGGTFALPAGFNGEKNLLSVYGLNGSRLRQALITRRVIDMKKDFSLPHGVYLVRAETR